jgi:CRISPR/Cas system CSM-associated protein Csm3 (group 7 of RAMP superfamily)
MDAAELLRDGRAPRRLRARWVLEGTLVLQTAAHLGGVPEDGTLDAPVLRVRVAGEPQPLLTGTCLGGALRSHLADVLGGYRTAEDERVQGLFGMPLDVEEDKRGEQSPLLVFDAIGRLPDGLATEIRDGVAIDAASGTAEERLKFDQELLPPGTTFPLRVDLVVADQLGEAGEADLLSLLVASLGGLGAGGDAGAVTIGARGSRGRGAARMRGWRAHRFELTSTAGWLAWLTSDHDGPLGATGPGPHPRPARTVAEAVHQAAPDLEAAPPDDLRRRVIIEADLALRAGLLVRSPADEPAAPDAAHLASGGSSILPGTSLAGALRTRLLRIARLVRERQGDAERWIDRLLGPRPQPGRRDDQIPLWASRLLATEQRLHDGRRVRTSRVRIDRFTQGVVAGALFDEESHDGGTLQVRLELRGPEPGELGLVLLGLKDLLSGDLPLGGTAAVGRGTVTGTATVKLDEHTTLRLRPGGTDDERSRALADELIHEFHQAPVLPTPEPAQVPAPAGGPR